ncbi:MAG TPA: hypothetical protein VN765_12305 [Candidatus Acidoferrum sp.]|nr:hypothetical protein [Candidatus Acidoferrum sp.]
MRKLLEIKLAQLPAGLEQGLPLTEVLHTLKEISISNDVENIGVNFMFNPRVLPGGSADNPPTAAPTTVDAGTITVKITPPLHNVTLLEALDAICQVADQPLSYIVGDYSVWFSVKPPGIPSMETRLFQVDPSTFIQRLQGLVSSLANAGDSFATNASSWDNSMVTRYFTSLGVNLTYHGAFAFFNPRNGDVVVRATMQDLDRVAQAIERINTAVPQVQLDVKFASVASEDYKSLGLDWPLTNATPVANNATILNILHDRQFHSVINAIEQHNGTSIIVERVTTESGRQAHIAAGDIRDITGRMIWGGAPSGGSVPTNGTDNPPNSVQASDIIPMRQARVQLRYNPLALDVVPTISPDGSSIQIAAITSGNLPVGYDNPGELIPQGMTDPPGIPGHSPGLPMPHYRVRQTVITTNVLDGDTLVLHAFPPENATKQNARLLIFITPTIVDPAGNRLHADGEKPAAPPQPGRSPAER